MSRRSWKRWAACAIAASLAACGGREDEAVEGQNAAVVANAACTDADLSAPSGSCPSAWQYDAYKSPCYKSSVNAVCGSNWTAQKISFYPTCRNAKFGTTAAIPTYSLKLTTLSGGYGGSPGSIAYEPFGTTCGGNPVYTGADARGSFTVAGPVNSEAAACTQLATNKLAAVKTSNPLGIASTADYRAAGSMRTFSCNKCMTSTGCYLPAAGYGQPPTYVPYGGTVPTHDEKVCDVSVYVENLGQDLLCTQPPYSLASTDQMCPTYGSCATACSAASAATNSCKTLGYCQDSANPSRCSGSFAGYKTCRNASAGADDAWVCGTSTSKAYSALGVAEPTRATCTPSVDPGCVPGGAGQCLSFEQVSDPRTRFFKLLDYATKTSGYTYDGKLLYPGNTSGLDIAGVQRVATVKLKLLLELKGDSLQESDRNAIWDLMVSRPDQAPSCGTSWVVPPTGSPGTWTFENGALPPSPVRATISSTDRHSGVRSLSLAGTSASPGSVIFEFVVPAGGGTVSFWYKDLNADHSGGSATLQDVTAGTTSASLDASTAVYNVWTLRSLTLAAGAAGHTVRLTLANRSSTASAKAVLYDDVTFPFVMDATRVATAAAALQVCQRGLAVRPEVGALLRDRCLQASDLFSWSTSLPYRADFVSQYVATVGPFLARVQAVPPSSSLTATERKAELQKRLALVNSWWKSVYKGGVTSYPGLEQLWKDASLVVGATWKGLQAAGEAGVRQSGSSASIQAFEASALTAERELLDAMFTSTSSTATVMPIDSAPALFLLADAAQAIVERLDALAPYHDVGCRYLQCGVNHYQTELGSLYQVLGALANQTAVPVGAPAGTPAQPVLAYALTTAEAGYSRTPGYYSANWPTYDTLFQKVKTYHAAVIQAAVKDARNVATYDGLRDVLRQTTSGSGPLVAFSAMVQRAAKRGNSFAAHGLLERDSELSLPTGLLASKMTAIDGHVDSALGSLGQAIGDYQSLQGKYVSDLLVDLDSQAGANDILTRKATLWQKAHDLAADDAGLLISAAIDRARFADLTTRVREASQSATAPYVTQNPLAPALFNGRDGRQTLGSNAPADIVLVRKAFSGANGAFTRGAAGEILSLSVSGSYQPTCALQAASQFYGTSIVGSAGPLSDAEAGSTGFGLQFATGQFQTHTYTDATSESYHVSVEACAGGGWDVGMGFSASVKACTGYTWSHTETTSDANGSEARTSAAFALGLRLPSTPFPNYPAGALLAVLMKPGTTALTPANVIDVQVVGQPQAAVVFGQDADLFFVVNDTQCTTSANNRTLQVNAVKLVPAAAAMNQLAAAMRTTEPYLRGEADKLVPQGRLLPDDINALRNRAWTELALACGGCDTNAFAPMLRGYYEAWLDNHVVHIQREIERIAILREMNQLTLETAAVERDVDLLGQKARYAGLLPRLSLRNLEFANDKLTQAVGQVKTLVSDELYPMVYLRYPEVFNAINQSQVAKLVALDWVGERLGTTGDGSSLAGKLYLGVKEIQNRLDLAVLNSTDPGLGDLAQATVAVRFPNPHNPPQARTGDTLPFPGKAVDEARALELWRSLWGGMSGSSEPVRFEIRPDDLYKTGTVNGSLPCTFVAPAVRSMAVLLVTEGAADAYNAQDIKVPTQVRSMMDFATLRGLEPFLFDNADWTLTPVTKPIYGWEADWTAKFAAIPPSYLNSSVSGVSPFTQFTLASLGAYADPFWDPYTDPAPDLYAYVGPGSWRTSDFVVVMQLEARRRAATVPGVAACR